MIVVLNLIGAALTLVSASNAQLPITVPDGTLCHPGRLLVRIDSSRLPVFRQNLAKIGGSVYTEFPEIGYVSVAVRRGALQASRAAIEQMPGVQAVQWDRAARAAYTPNDPLWGQMDHLRTLKLDLAWNQSLGSNNVIVAIMDTGVLGTHEDLATNMWHNTGEILGNNIDDDNNGFIDDDTGWDFAYGDRDPNDVNGHGTACAGLVAAVGDNSLGGIGAAPRAKIMAMKIAIDSGYFYDTANIGGFLYATANGAKIFSMSYFSDRVSLAERTALEYCVSQGVLPVVAAGNDNTIYSYYPGAYEVSLSVAALATNGNRASFSNYGSWVDVASPGTSLTAPTNNGAYTATFAGTSGACPQVAGVAALLKGANPALSMSTIRGIIEDTGVQLISPSVGEYTNYGRVDAQAALAAALGTLPSPRPARAVYIAPHSTGRLRRGDVRIPNRIYGRGFQSPNLVEVYQGLFKLKVVDRQRDWIDTELVTDDPVVVKVNGATIATLPAAAQTLRRSWTASEASTQSATRVGGFAQFAASDSSAVNVTARNDGTFLLHTTFRRVALNKAMKLTFRRRYNGATSGAGALEIYNWASNSYPYGSFNVLVNETSLTTSYATTVVTIPNITNFVDPDGTVLIKLSGTIPTTGTIDIDQLTLEEI